MTDAHILATPEQVRPGVDCRHCGTTICGSVELGTCVCGAEICNRCTGGWCCECKRAIHNDCASIIDGDSYCRKCGAEYLDRKGERRDAA